MPLSLAIPIIAMALQAGGQAYGASKSASSMRKVRGYLDDRIRETDGYYGSRIEQDYLDTAEAKSAISAMREGMKKNLQSLNNSGVAKGMTDEGRVAAAGELNDRFAQGMSRIAGQGTAYKERLRESWRAEKNNLEGQKMGVQAADAAKWGQFGNNVANAGGSLLYAWGNGAFDSAKSGSGGTGQMMYGASQEADHTLPGEVKQSNASGLVPKFTDY